RANARCALAALIAMAISAPRKTRPPCSNGTGTRGSRSCEMTYNRGACMMGVHLFLGMWAALIANPAVANDEKLPALIRASQPADLFLAARLQGQLQLDEAGCLRVAKRNGDPGPFVIWSLNSRIERAEDGRVRSTDSFSGKIVHVGDEVVMG